MRPSTQSGNPRHVRLAHIFLYALLLLFLLPGCSGKGGGNPAVPGVTGDDSGPEAPALTAATVYPESVPGQTGGKAVWGVWDISLDSENGFQVVPVRDAEYSLNVNIFLQPPAGKISNIQIDMINMEKLFIAGEVVVDVSLTHPFPQLTQFSGFDVLGVLIGKGSYILDSDSSVHCARPDLDPILKNADGYTRWMNQPEFTTPGLRGYTEGALGNKKQFWGSTVNPYKYFATDLTAVQSIVDYYRGGYPVAQRGLFSTNATNTRRYVLDFPIVNGYPDVRFQYAVVASWIEPLNNPPLSIPGDFPAAANMQEAFHCAISTIGSTLYWNNMYDNGGYLYLTLEIFDWQGMTNSTGVAGEISKIIVESPDDFINNGLKMVFRPGDWTELERECANSAKLFLDIGPVKPGGPCPYDNDVMITIVTAEMGDYDNGLGGAYPTTAVLSSYARLFYDMGYVCNDPPIVWFVNCPTAPVETFNMTFIWDGEDDVTPNAELQYRYHLDSEPWSEWETNLKTAYFEDMSPGTHTVWLECRDMDGQVSGTQCVFSIQAPPEPQPPSVEFVNCTPYVRSSSYTFLLAISDDNTNRSHMKVRYNYDGGGWVDLPDGTTSVTLNGLTSGGPHQLIVEVEDLDGMKDQAECEFYVNFSPDVSIDCPPQDINNSSYTMTWTGTDPESDPLEYQSKLDGGAWTAWGTATSRLLTGLTSGNHTFYVNVRDSTNGTDQDVCPFHVNFPPTIQITNKPSQDLNSTSYTFNWTASDDLDSPATMQYNVERDGVWVGWQTGISSYNWTGLTSGSHTFRVRVRDNGNPQLTADDLCNFVVNFKPSVQITNCPSGIWGSKDITFTWMGTDDNSPAGSMSYSYKLDADPWSPWQLGQLSVALIGLSETDHTFRVKVRDTGNPPLYCDTAPDTCDICDFTIDTSCAFPPVNVTSFSASDGLMILNSREVQLTWDPILACVNWYDIERLEYNWGSGLTQWVPLVSLPETDTSYTDTDARYSGTADPIGYRIKARNATGSSPSWAVDTGYPVPRNINMAMWCTADDASGGGASTTWARAAGDYMNCNDFWNDYGVNFVLKNSGDFFWIPEPGLKNLNGSEPSYMHQNYGQVVFPDSINVYFVTSSNGNTGTAYCVCYCPGTSHTTRNIFIVMCSEVSGPGHENEIVLAHEIGHGASRLFDEYLLDTNRDIIQDSTCAAENTWCITPPFTPPLFCDDNSCYPENPGASGKVPKQLMWYSFVGHIIAEYDISEPQWYWVEDWIHGYESNYPWP